MSHDRSGSEIGGQLLPPVINAHIEDDPSAAPSSKSAELCLAQTVEKFRAATKARMHERLMYELATRDKDTDAYQYILCYLCDGKDKFRERCMGFWHQIGVVTALIGGMAIQVVMRSISRSEIIKTSNWYPSDWDSMKIFYLYYSIWSLAAACEMAAMLLVIVAGIHFNLMVSEDDMIWFWLRWEFVCNRLPQGFLFIGIICMVVGCCVGSFLYADYTTGIIVCLVGGLMCIAIFIGWKRMLSINRQRQLRSSERFFATLEGVRKDAGIAEPQLIVN